jgi:fructose/tagatose bisphosphate aldolase
MRSPHDSFAEAARKGTAVGHFNVSDLVGLNAVAAAARRLVVPRDVARRSGSDAVKTAAARRSPSDGADTRL